MPESTPDHDIPLSIGTISKYTGIPVETLRTWERRYGFPSPERDSAGHRVYRYGTVDHLRVISKILARGHRPSQVLGLPLDDLRALLEQSQPEPAPPAKSPRRESPLAVPQRSTESAQARSESSDSVVSRPPRADRAELGSRRHCSEAQAVVEQMLQATIKLDAPSFNGLLQQHWFRRGALQFLQEILTPFLRRVGTAWAGGEIAVLHEQFASRHVRDFLRNQWEPINDLSRGPSTVCLTLPGEYHILGLHLIAIILTMAGYHVSYLDCDVPLSTIPQLLEEHSAQILAISVSQAAHRPIVERQLQALLPELPSDCQLLLGGAGAPEGIEASPDFDNLEDIFNWAQQQLHGQAV